MSVIKAVLFDADGVLQRPAYRWRRAFGELPGLTEEAPLDQFARDVLDIEATFLECEDDFAVAMAELVERSGHRFDAGTILTILNAIEVDAAIMDVVQSLRSSGIKCYLASNQQMHRALHMSETLGYAGLFDGEFYSCRLGVAKPKLSFFERVLAVLDLPGDAVLFLDDRAENVAGALQAGLYAAVFDGAAGRSALSEMLLIHGLQIQSPPSERYLEQA